MQSVGQKLREARLAAGVSLDQVSAGTRISIKLLQAIEEDDFSKFDSGFFYKSFVRQFAGHLKLSLAELEPALQACSSNIAEPLVPGQTRFKPDLPALNIGRPAKVKWGYSLASLIAMLVVCSGVYSVWQRSIIRVDIPSAPSDQASNAAVESTPLVLPKSPETVSSPDRSNAGFRIELSAVERTWLSIVDDGRKVFSGVLGAEQTKILVGHTRARIRAGNAGGVNVVFNGRSLGPLGPRGQVAIVVFTAKGYKILEPSAHMAPVAFIPSGE